VKTRLALVILWLLCLIAAPIGLVWMAIAILPNSNRAWAIARGFDRLGAAIARGDDGEYISSSCWRYRAEQPYRTLRWLIDRAFGLVGERDHCKQSFIFEQRKAIARLENQLPRSAV
jgi:hypothetical protein